MKTLKIFILGIFLINYSTFALSIEPREFIQSTVDKASNTLSKEITNEEKIEILKSLALESVDIKGIGFYTLGKHRKSLNDDQKETYSILFRDYFLKSFSSRLVEWTDPKIIVNNEEVLNKNYTIVDSILRGTDQRPEINIQWRVYTKNKDKPVIRDVIIEGLSLARTQKEEFSSIINSNDGDIDALFKTLKEFAIN